MKLLKNPWVWAAAAAGVVLLVFGRQMAAGLGLGMGDAIAAGSSNAGSPDVRTGGKGQDQAKPTSSNGAKPPGSK